MNYFREFFGGPIDGLVEPLDDSECTCVEIEEGCEPPPPTAYKLSYCYIKDEDITAVYSFIPYGEQDERPV